MKRVSTSNRRDRVQPGSDDPSLVTPQCHPGRPSTPRPSTPSAIHNLTNIEISKATRKDTFDRKKKLSLSPVVDRIPKLGRLYGRPTGRPNEHDQPKGPTSPKIRKISLENYRQRITNHTPLTHAKTPSYSLPVKKPIVLENQTRVNRISTNPLKVTTPRESRPRQVARKHVLREEQLRRQWISEETIRDIRDARGDRICNLCRLTGPQKRINYHTRQHYTRWFCTCGYTSSSRDGVDAHARREIGLATDTSARHQLYEADIATFPELIEHLGWTKPPVFNDPTPILKPTHTPPLSDASVSSDSSDEEIPEPKKKRNKPLKIKIRLPKKKSVFQRLGASRVTEATSELEDGEISSPPPKQTAAKSSPFLILDNPHDQLIYEGAEEEVNEPTSPEKEEKDEPPTFRLTTKKEEKEGKDELPPSKDTTSVGTQTDPCETYQMAKRRDERHRATIRALQRALRELQQ